MNKLLHAANFAAIKHAAQRRKDHAETPYINHPIEVAEHLNQVGGIEDENILIAALLHDTIEDTETSEDEIRNSFGDSVLELVLECSDDKTLNSAERKQAQIISAAHKSDGAKLIKIADKTCNLRSILIDPPKGWAMDRQIEYFEWAEKVFAGLKGVNESLDADLDHVLTMGLRTLRCQQE